MPVTRTKALPKNSLFGSVLENIKPDEVQRILKEADAKRKATAGNEVRVEEVNDWIPERFIQKRLDIERDQMELDHAMRQGKENLRNISHRLANLEGMRKYGVLHDTAIDTFRSSSKDHPTGMSQFSKRTTSTDRIPSTIETVLSSNRFAPVKSNTTYSTSYVNDRPLVLNRRDDESDQNGFRLSELEKRKFRIIEQMGPSTYVNKNGLSVPRNIVHQFGGQHCHEMLQDETIDSVRSASTPLVKPLTHSKSQQLKNLRDAQLPPLNTYTDLGRMVRYNVVPGLDIVKHDSLMKRSYLPIDSAKCDSVPDEHRYQWDNVSRWAEANILQQRVWKAWDEKQAAKVKPNTQN